MKGLSAYIYEDKLGNCSNNGISNRFKRVIIVGPNIPEVFEVDEESPAVEILTKDVYSERYVYARPIEARDNKKWYMMGGCFIYSCDSRFRELVNKYPVPLHDRVEGWK